MKDRDETEKLVAAQALTRGRARGRAQRERRLRLASPGTQRA